jgi:hypothetical protein
VSLWKSSFYFLGFLRGFRRAACMMKMLWISNARIMRGLPSLRETV